MRDYTKSYITMSKVSRHSILCYCLTYTGQLPVQLLPERDMQLQEKVGRAK